MLMALIALSMLIVTQFLLLFLMYEGFFLLIVVC